MGSLWSVTVNGPCDRIRKVNVRDVSGMLVERVFLVSGVVKTLFSPNKKIRDFFFFFYHEQKRVKPTSWVFLIRLFSLRKRTEYSGTSWNFFLIP